MGVGKDRLEVAALVLHAGENVVGGAVDDAHDRLDAIDAERTFERSDDRNTATDGGFDHDVDACGSGGFVNFFAVAGDDSFIGSDDMFAAVDSIEDESASRFETTDDFNDDIDIGIVDDAIEIGCVDRLGEVYVSGFEGSYAYFADF